LGWPQIMSLLPNPPTYWIQRCAPPHMTCSLRWDLLTFFAQAGLKPPISACKGARITDMSHYT
jgi:hypothetical protein